MLSKILAALLLSALVYLALEAGSLVAWRVSLGEHFSFADLKALQGRTSFESTSAVQDAFRSPSVVHPYLGMVYNPDTCLPSLMNVPVNDWGFFDDKPSVQKRRPDRVIVGVFGGSVAWWMSTMGGANLAKVLARHPEFAGKEIVIIRAANGAIKQPQQLMTLSYLIALGGEFDLVINLDGFNEVTIPPTHAIPKGVNPYFPAYWSELFVDFMDERDGDLVASIRSMESHRRRLVGLASARPFRWSVTSGTLWMLTDRLLGQRLSRLRLELKEGERTEATHYLLRGPAFTSKEEAMYAELAAMWQRGSLQMDAICRRLGIPYFHLLQPNQYVPDSKPLTEREKRVAYDEKLFWKEHAERGYPHLRRASERLTDSGVVFHDLTTLFAGNSEELYQDNCCHLTARGNELLAEEVGRIVVEALASNPSN
jgi:hypothetical protein